MVLNEPIRWSKDRFSNINTTKCWIFWKESGFAGIQNFSVNLVALMIPADRKKTMACSVPAKVLSFAR
jgi:hypothetical protein